MNWEVFGLLFGVPTRLTFENNGFNKFFNGLVVQGAGSQSPALRAGVLRHQPQQARPADLMSRNAGVCREPLI
ncbi:MAG TPA: hypothetical protein VE029_08515, partial [Rhizobacter sp.]|nr:hypothetical protein [Rhizobacter sp.]